MKKRKERRIILFGKSEEHKQAWLKDLQYCLWGANGKKGPDPSKSGAYHGMNPPRTHKVLLLKLMPLPLDVSYDSDDEPEPPQYRKQPPPKEEEDDASYGSSSGDEKEDPKGAGAGGDPLIIFDPFGEEAQRHQQGAGSTDPFGLGGYNPNLHQGVDARGQAIPKGKIHHNIRITKFNPLFSPCRCHASASSRWCRWYWLPDRSVVRGLWLPTRLWSWLQPSASWYYHCSLWRGCLLYRWR